MSSGNDLLMGGGGKSILWGRDDSTMNQWVSGTVVDEPTQSQVLDFTSKKPKFYDGTTDPIMQIVVRIQTSMRDDADDDGQRALFIKGTNMKHAVRDAVRATGAKGLEIGGQLAVRWTGTAGDNDARQWEARYKAAPAKANQALMGDDPFAAPAPAASAGVSGALVYPTQHMTPAQYAAPDPAPQGVDSAMWQSMGKEQRDGVRALLGGGAAVVPQQRADDSPPF